MKKIIILLVFLVLVGCAENSDCSERDYTCFADLAIQRNDINLCINATQGGPYDAVGSGCWRHFFDSFNDGKDCETVPEHTGSMTYDRNWCYRKIAVKIGNSELCEKALRPDYKNWCYREIAINSTNSIICDKISEPQIKVGCCEAIEDSHCKDFYDITCQNNIQLFDQIMEELKPEKCVDIKYIKSTCQKDDIILSDRNCIISYSQIHNEQCIQLNNTAIKGEFKIIYKEALRGRVTRCIGDACGGYLYAILKDNCLIFIHKSYDIGWDLGSDIYFDEKVEYGYQQIPYENGIENVLKI